MKVDIQDVLFWMDAIRNSSDRYRTLESFWKGQIKSKLWVIKILKLFPEAYKSRIAIHGGWNGVLASLLFNSELDPSYITSIDIDPACREIASTVNKRQEIEGKFCSITADMCEYTYNADVVINTSCEHITQYQYDQWLSRVPQNSLIVLQSNNYYELDEHIRCCSSVEEFIGQSKISSFWAESLTLPKYERYMIVGKKNVYTV